MIRHDSEGSYPDGSRDHVLDSPGSATERAPGLAMPLAPAETTSTRRNPDALVGSRRTHRPRVRGQRGSTNGARLTPRETEVLRWMAQGLSNSGIARRLFVSKKTVELHIGRIFDKFELHEELGTNRRVVAVIRWLSQEG